MADVVTELTTALLLLAVLLLLSVMQSPLEAEWHNEFTHPFPPSPFLYLFYISYHFILIQFFLKYSQIQLDNHSQFQYPWRASDGQPVFMSYESKLHSTGQSFPISISIYEITYNAMLERCGRTIGGIGGNRIVLTSHCMMCICCLNHYVSYKGVNNVRQMWKAINHLSINCFHHHPSAQLSVLESTSVNDFKEINIQSCSCVAADLGKS